MAWHVIEHEFIVKKNNPSMKNILECYISIVNHIIIDIWFYESCVSTHVFRYDIHVAYQRTNSKSSW